MTSLFRRLLQRMQHSKTPGHEAAHESFAARFHRFKLFLSSHIEAYSEMMTFEERIAGDAPLGMPFLRMCTAKLTVATMQCILQLNTLGEGRYGRLNAPFAALREKVQEAMNRGTWPLEGPLVIPYSAAGSEYRHLIAPNLFKLEAIRRKYPEFMPKGFIVTGAAWWRYFNDPDMHDEVDRIMLISQDDPGSYGEAGATIRERMMTSFLLPEDVEKAIAAALDDLGADLGRPGRILLVRCFPVRPEHGALVMPEQVLRTPLDVSAVVDTVRSALTQEYRSRAMIYRLKLGVRDRAMPLCISLTLLEGEQARGSTHRGLDRATSDQLTVHIRRGLAVPEGLPAQASVVGATLPDIVREAVEEKSLSALTCLADAPVPGNRHEIFWAASEEGRFSVMGVNALPDPEPEDPKQDDAADEDDAGEGNDCVLLGGLSTYPGTMSGQAFLVRNLEDALLFPMGSILVLGKASPRWSFLLEFASGAITGDGTGNGYFARTARRYGRPTILGQPRALETLVQGQWIHIDAETGRPPRVLRCLEGGAVETGAEPDGDDPGQTVASVGHAYAPLWLPSSDIAVMTRELAPQIVPLTLPDNESTDFRAENCSTYHDFLIYCHDHAVREMFRYGTSRKTSQAPAKQLVCDVPKQFWLINLDDGFYGEVNGPAVPLDRVASIPMRSLWEGFVDKPWDLPQLNAKGFMSVLFEASANPSLDPASQSTQYTEKNVFLIARRFCSMRCRFGFHFLSMDCLLGERARERFIIFQFKGGAANLARRVRRVHFVAELLAQFDFATEIVGDTLTARMEQGDEAQFLSALRVIGYLVMHTRQLDMIMGDDAALAARRFQMLEDMRSLATRPPLVLP